jgi:Zn-dependent protease
MQLNLTDIAIILGSILISMTLHEAMHGFVSHWLGDDTAQLEGRLTLNPLAHIDLMTTVLLPLMLVILGLPPFGAAKPVPFNPYKVKWGEWGVALVGISGPLTNLVLAIGAGVAARFIGTGLGSTTLIAIEAFAQVNIAFFLFNMIPFPPLDGSRVLFAIAPDSVRQIMLSIEGMGIMGLLVFMFIFYQFIGPEFTHVFQWLYTLIVGSAGV